MITDNCHFTEDDRDKIRQDILAILSKNKCTLSDTKRIFNELLFQIEEYNVIDL